MPEVERILEGYVASNASTLVLSSVSGQDGYDSRPELDDKGWQTLLDNLSRISQVAAAAGHPRRAAPARRHDDREHRRGAAGAGRARRSRCAWTPGTCSSAAPTPPSSPGRHPTGSRTSTSRTSTPSKAKHVQDGRWTYTEGVTRGMYRPLGTGDVDVAAIVEHLTKRGYDGWYTLEQDTILEDEPDGRGPGRRRPDQRGQPARRAAEDTVTVPPTEPLRVGHPRRGPHRRAGDRQAGARHRHPARHGRGPRPARAPRRSPPSTASSGRPTPTPRCWPTPRSRSSTTRCRTRCTGRGTSPRSRRASTCSRRSRSPPPPRRPRRSVPPRRRPASPWWRASTTCSTR